MGKPSGKTMTVGGGGNKLRANQQEAGIPDSKPFIAPESAQLEGGVDRLKKCHIKGVLVSELGLDPAVLVALDYYATDEGIAEKENRPMAREASGVVLGADGFNKALEQRRDDVIDKGMDNYQARDPLKEVADKHARPGFTPKFLSEKKVKENGTTGDYEIAKDDKGDPVRVRGMVLGHAPTERVKARNRHFRERGNKALKQIGEQYKREGGSTAVADQ